MGDLRQVAPVPSASSVNTDGECTLARRVAPADHQAQCLAHDKQPAVVALTTASLGPSVPRSSNTGSPFKRRPQDGDSPGHRSSLALAPEPQTHTTTESTAVQCRCARPSQRPPKLSPSTGIPHLCAIGSSTASPTLPPGGEAPPFPLLTPTTTVGGRGVSAEDPLCAPHSHAGAPAGTITPPPPCCPAPLLTLRRAHRLQGSPQRGSTPH